MQSARRGRGRPPYPDVLTPAEWSVLLLVRQGLTNGEVARRRGTTVDAVRYHLENIAGKLGLDTREQLRHWDGTARGEGQLDLGRQHRRTRMTSPAPTPAATLTANASFLLVHDVARTAAWFRDTLGFTIGDYLREQHESAAEEGLGEPVFCFVSRDGQRVALSKATGEGAGPGVRSNRDDMPIANDVYFWVDGIDALYDEVRSRGARFADDLHETAYDMREFTVRSPDGHALTFGE